MRVYLDVIGAVNFLVDLSLILAVYRLWGDPMAWARALGAAGLGAVYGIACFLPGLEFLGKLHWRSICLCLMGLIAFGSWKRLGTFLLLSFSLGGLGTLLQIGGFWGTVICALGIWAFSALTLGGALGKAYVDVEFPGPKPLRLRALRDTGNSLRDPLTGEGVLVVDAGAAKTLLGLSQSQLVDPLGTVAAGEHPGVRLVPYHTVGAPNGMMLAKRFPRVKIGRRAGPRLVAFAPGILGQDYRALTGGIG